MRPPTAAKTTPNGRVIAKAPVVPSASIIPKKLSQSAAEVGVAQLCVGPNDHGEKSDRGCASGEPCDAPEAHPGLGLGRFRALVVHLCAPSAESRLLCRPLRVPSLGWIPQTRSSYQATTHVWGKRSRVLHLATGGKHCSRPAEERFAASAR